MIKIAAVDDNKIFVEALSRKVNDECKMLDSECLVDKYSNGYDFLENYGKYYLIFLDIEMPQLDGISVAQKINELKGDKELPLVAFLTSHDEKVFEALKNYPYTFIRKSDLLEDNNSNRDISRCLRKVLQITKNNSVHINIRTKRRNIVVNICDIIYLVKQNNYTYVVVDEKYPVKLPLWYFEDSLFDYGFVRCYEGYIINLNYIVKISDKQITLNNGETIPISRNKVKSTRQAFMKRMVESNV